MLQKLLPILLVLAIPAAKLCAQQEQEFQHCVLNNTELRPFHSEISGRDYLLYIGYPDSYQSNPDKQYPVVYVTDAYWAFVKTYSLGSSLWYDQAVPEYIVVGIGYKDTTVDYNRERLYELTPSKQDYGWTAGVDAPMGGARKFLSSIKDEIIPYIEKNTHADPSFRVMAGSSLGGLFSLFCMYEEPGLFQGIIAGSPAVPWDHRWLFKRESELRNAAIGNDGKDTFNLHTRLFMCVGDQEWNEFQGEIQAFDNIISHSGYGDFEYQFRVIDGERHGGNVAEAYNRGLRFVFLPQRPSATIPD